MSREQQNPKKENPEQQPGKTGQGRPNDQKWGSQSQNPGSKNQ